VERCKKCIVCEGCYLKKTVPKPQESSDSEKYKYSHYFSISTCTGCLSRGELSGEVAGALPLAGNAAQNCGVELHSSCVFVTGR
jgi:uncharacterized metal-binding protein